MTLLPLAYLPSVAYCAHLLRGGCVVDLGEHFVKRSERNRTRILAADGVMELTVNVQRANHPRMPMRDVRLDYSKRWPHQHWTALVSSYKASPYFDHYAPSFEPFYRREFRFLVDYNRELLEVLLGALGIPMPALSDRYVEASSEDRDLRPKRRDAFAQEPLLLLSGQAKGPDDFAPEPYVQVFSDRLPFVPNLSAVDLLFAEGPASIAVLRRCLR